MNIRESLLAAATLVALSGPALAAQDIVKTVKVAADATIDVSNVQGRVDVTAWERSEVELVARLESDRDKLEFQASERQVLIEVVRPDSKRRRDDEDDAILTLKVPKSARLIVDTVSADIRVAGVQGEQRLESVSGLVETQSFDQPVTLESVSGDIRLTGNGGGARVTTENVSGSTVVKGIRGGYEGEAVSGDITASVAAAERLRASSVSGDVRIQAGLAPAARVDMESVSGEIALTMQPPVNAEFDIESFSGDIESCFGTKARRKSKYSPGSELNFTQGSGGARVVIQTLSGDVRVCDR